MQLRVPGHERTVHPHLARAALLGVRRHGPGATAEEVARLQATGAPVPERLHHRLLAELAGHGWPALTGAAGHLLDRPREGDVAEMIDRGALPELLALLPSIQLRYHVGHTTELRLDGDLLTVTHRALLGHPPNPAESLFTAAVHEVLVGACTGRRPKVTLLLSGSVRLPTAKLMRTGGTRPAAATPAGVASAAGSRLAGWELDLGGPPSPQSPAAVVRDMIAADPARSWRLEAVAARLATSSRSLQRALAAEGTGLRELAIETRVGIARGLVQRTDLGLAEVAAACGFTDHAHLTRCFTARHGIGPAALRRTGQEEGRAPS
ncbi:helix-turn-helix transcriptional regulator [Catellatospora bangladeshensis]|uniref:helix-turn-helix transcriptional regulator n=1 Tax=Catellatospora bangladeshensis TaxID=310355 RepID=UPI003620A612